MRGQASDLYQRTVNGVKVWGCGSGVRVASVQSVGRDAQTFETWRWGKEVDIVVGRNEIGDVNAWRREMEDQVEGTDVIASQGQNGREVKISLKPGTVLDEAAKKDWIRRIREADAGDVFVIFQAGFVIIKFKWMGIWGPLPELRARYAIATRGRWVSGAPGGPEVSFGRMP